MQIAAPAIVCAARAHGEHGVIVRALTEAHGLLAGYVSGGRSRTLRPVLVPGNTVAGNWHERGGAQLASLTVEPLHSRAQLMTEPLAAAGIDWATALTAATLPEAHPYPALFQALEGLLGAIEHAPAARGWAGAMARYEELLLAQLGYGEEVEPHEAPIETLARNRKRLVAHLLGERRRDVMAARERLVERLKRAVA